MHLALISCMFYLTPMTSNQGKLQQGFFACLCVPLSTKGSSFSSSFLSVPSSSLPLPLCRGLLATSIHSSHSGALQESRQSGRLDCCRCPSSGLCIVDALLQLLLWFLCNTACAAPHVTMISTVIYNRILPCRAQKARQHWSLLAYAGICIPRLMFPSVLSLLGHFACYIHEGKLPGGPLFRHGCLPTQVGSQVLSCETAATSGNRPTDRSTVCIPRTTFTCWT